MLLLGAAIGTGVAAAPAVPAAASGPASLSPIDGTQSSGPVGGVHYHYDYSNNCLQPYGCFQPGAYRIVLDFERSTEIGETPATLTVSAPQPSGWANEHASGDVGGQIPDWPRSQPTTYSLTGSLIPASGPPIPGTDATVTYTVTTVSTTYKPKPVANSPARPAATGGPSRAVAPSPAPTAPAPGASAGRSREGDFPTGGEAGPCTDCVAQIAPLQVSASRPVWLVPASLALVGLVVVSAGAGGYHLVRRRRFASNQRDG